MEQADRAFWVLLLVILAVIAMKYLPRYQARAPFVDPHDLKQRLDAGEDVVVVDVRTAREYLGGRGHIPGAVNLSVGDLKVRLQQRMEDVEAWRGRRIYVYEQGELRAASAARAFSDAKFVHVSVIKGGLKAWLRRGFPVEHG